MGDGIKLDHDINGDPVVRVYLGRDADGKQVRRQRTFRGMTDEQALPLAHDFAAKEREAFGEAKDLKTQLNRYLNSALASGSLSKSSVRKYRSCLRKITGKLARTDVNEVTPYMLEEFLIKLSQTLESSTVRACQQFVRGAYTKYFVPYGLADHNPAEQMPQVTVESKPRRGLEEAHLKKVKRWVEQELANKDNDLRSLRRRATALAAYIALMTGMRVGEICGLKLGNVSAKTRTIHVAATVVDGEYQSHTKSHKPRNVTIGYRLLAAIQQYVEDTHEALGLDTTRDMPLLTIDGAHVTPGMIDKQWSQMRAEMGIPNGSHTAFHCLRHNHATSLLSSGHDMSAVKSRLGHARITTTDENYHYALPGYDESLAAEMESEWQTY